MPLPVMISFQVPYTDNEQEFLAHVVQAALRQFRCMNMNPHSEDAAKTSPIEPSFFASAQEQLQTMMKKG
jgi:hypothetical protein